MITTCQCEIPMIKCDHLGCRCTICGKFPTPKSTIDLEEERFKRYKELGKSQVHYCPDWDFMAIHADMPEFESCCCEGI